MNKNSPPIIILSGLLLILTVGIVLFSRGQASLKFPAETSQAKYYDWNTQLIMCNNCSPYANQFEYFNKEELVIAKDKVLRALPEGEYMFTDYSTIPSGEKYNGIKISLTEKGRNKLDTLDLTKLNVKTVRYSVAIDESTQAVPRNEEELLSCNEDRECISVDSGCCGCNAGGNAIPINRKFYNYWNGKLKQDCKETFCPAVLSNDPSCEAKPKCVNNTCVL